MAFHHSDGCRNAAECMLFGITSLLCVITVRQWSPVERVDVVPERLDFPNATHERVAETSVHSSSSLANVANLTVLLAAFCIIHIGHLSLVNIVGHKSTTICPAGSVVRLIATSIITLGLYLFGLSVLILVPLHRPTAVHISIDHGGSFHFRPDMYIEDNELVPLAVDSGDKFDSSQSGHLVHHFDVADNEHIALVVVMKLLTLTSLICYTYRICPSLFDGLRQGRTPTSPSVEPDLEVAQSKRMPIPTIALSIQPPSPKCEVNKFDPLPRLSVEQLISARKTLRHPPLAVESEFTLAESERLGVSGERLHSVALDSPLPTPTVDAE